MKVTDLRIGLAVRHPQYGVGAVIALNEHTAEVRFDSGKHTMDPRLAGLESAEPTASFNGLSVPLGAFVEQTVGATLDKLGHARPDEVVSELGGRWHGGRLVLHPADPALQTKEVPLDAFFHKIVMVRNQLRVLEQKLNAHGKLTDGEKVEMQQYVTRCYGSLTTFNLLFKEKEGQF